MSEGTRKPQVIIVGAGLGGLSAAWHLSRHRDVDVMVYEASWVPGGKAVSGRDPEPPVGRPHLIEEHGLHMLFGTYHEAWRMLGECYRELNRPVSHAFRHIEQAFTPQRRVVFDQREQADDPRQHWVFCPEECPGHPWDADRADLVTDDLGLLGRFLMNIEAKTHDLLAVANRLCGPAVHPFEASRQRAFSALANLSGEALAEQIISTSDMRGWTKQVIQLCTPLRASSLWLSPPWFTLGQLLRLATSARRSAELLDLAFAILDGTRELAKKCTCRANEKACDCLDKLNTLDLRDWLTQNHWNPENDAIVRGFYAGLFALEGELAAGVGLRAMLRVLFDYRGAMVYRMESGMGEVVVAPIYLALRQRNVQFHFLKRLTAVEVRDGGVSRLTFERLGGLPDDYEPYKTAETLHGTLEYFPNTPPSRARLEAAPPYEFHRMHRRWTNSGVSESVELGANDHVILAIPPKVLNHVAGALKQHQSWKRFLEGETATKSRGIVSVQIWRNLTPDLGPNPIKGAVAAGHLPPFEVWADMSHVLSREGSPHNATELSFACGPRDGEKALTQQDAIAHADQKASNWLATETTYMLGRIGTEVRRYVAASLELSDEYVLSCPNTIDSRMRPGETGFSNLSVAGDWVKNGLDCGCVESAVTGGILAAKSIP